MMVLMRASALFIVLCVTVTAELPAQQSGGQGGSQGGSGANRDQFCPYAYLFSTDDIHFYRMKKCSQSSFAYEGFGEEVDPLGCAEDSSCKCGCLPNTHNPALADQTTTFTEQADANALQYGAPNDLANQRSLKVTFPDTGEEQCFRIVRVQLKSNMEWKWLGVPTEDAELEAKAYDGMMAIQSVTGNPRAWGIGFNPGTGMTTAWVMRRQ